MRRKDREVTQIEEILEILDQCQVCRIAMIDEGRPYIVPLNFGYTYEADVIELYFHSALKGKKIECLKQNPLVCIEMDCKHELVESEQACKNGYLYASLIAEGETTFLETVEEKKNGLNVLMKHIVGKAFTFEDKMVGGVAVFKVTLTSISVKARKQ